MLLALLLSGPALASKPFATRIDGCVLDGRLYDVQGDTAYPIGIALDLARYEGKRIAVEGTLSPRDRFSARGAVSVVSPRCPKRMRQAIAWDQAVNLRIAAGRAAEAGDFPTALDLVAQAMQRYTPPDCDAYADRATIYAQMGDIPAATEDLVRIQHKRCARSSQVNFLLLEHLGDALLAQGELALAKDAYQVAVEGCGGASYCERLVGKAAGE
ncbi:MAG: hypothetical protein Q8P41_02145 [Pseudomonadota bacterium]|nr:hypothetical protein [Pseudomonadota bacterium]